MELHGKQRRLLVDLDDIDSLGGELQARLEHGDHEDFYRIAGWKGTTSEPLDLHYTIGATALAELSENGCIALEPIAADKHGLKITPGGQSLLDTGQD